MYSVTYGDAWIKNWMLLLNLLDWFILGQASNEIRILFVWEKPAGI